MSSTVNLKKNIKTKSGFSKAGVHYIDEIVANLHSQFLLTLGTHWNMVDPRFYFLHTMLKEHYEIILEEMDDVAGRLRAIGSYAPFNPHTLLGLTTLTLPHEGKITANEALSCLIDAYERVVFQLKNGVHTAENAGDIATQDLLTQILRAQEKRLWMLKSHDVNE